MHLVGFIIRIYHDARSSKNQIRESDLFHQCRRNFYQTQAFISLPFAFTMSLATSASVHIVGQKKTPTTHVKIAVVVGKG